ncbi:MAG: hypothetical protein AABZ60_03820 [Planctomycetota bacterium]
MNLEVFDCPDTFDEVAAAKLIRKTYRILVLITVLVSLVSSLILALIFQKFLTFPARFVLFLSPTSGLGLILYRICFHSWDNKISQLVIHGKTWGKVFSSHYSGKSLLLGSLPGNFLPIIGPACGITFAYMAFTERAKSVGGKWVGEEIALTGLILSILQLGGTLNAGLYYLGHTPWF